MNNQLIRVADALVAEGVFADRERFLRLFRSVFRGTDLQGKSLLDIGCGVGALAVGAVASGARVAVGLEPEFDGSTAGVVDAGNRLIKDLALDAVTVRRLGIDEYDFSEGPFDVIVMYNVINHLDEDACAALRHSREASNRYVTQLKRLYDHLTPGGHLVVADCARSNFFGDMRIRNPIVSTIEWEKHQNPTLWSKLLISVGFSSVDYWWNPVHQLRFLGPLAASRAVAYITNSHFVLRAVK